MSPGLCDADLVFAELAALGVPSGARMPQHRKPTTTSSYQNREMAPPSEISAQILAKALPLPLEADLWESVVQAMKLSSRQARIVELILRDLSDKQIALVLGISESTIETHKERIRLRTGARGRMQLAMQVLAVSHQIRK